MATTRSSSSGAPRKSRAQAHSTRKDAASAAGNSAASLPRGEADAAGVPEMPDGAARAPTLGEALAWARRYVPPLEARVLLGEAAGVRLTTLTAFPERPLPGPAWERFRDWVVRRAAGEPVAYLTGSREFFGRTFRVTPDVLIPRPETETLIELAIAYALALPAPVRILDLGTGSGCIAVTLALELPHAEVVAVDASAAALAVARDNAARLGASVSFLHGDWFAPVGNERFDLIVSNPPYVAPDDAHLAMGDVRFEPRLALVAEHAGLAAIEAIVEEAPRFLRPGGRLLLEHGAEQGAAVRVRLAERGFGDIVTCLDLEQRERISGGQWEG